VSDADNLVGVIFAEGRSSLWGNSQSIPTALLPVCGKPLLAHRIDEFRDLGLQRIVVVTDEKKAIDAARISLGAFSLSLDICALSEGKFEENEKLIITSANQFSEPVFSARSEIPLDTVVYNRSGYAIGASTMGSSIDKATAALRGTRHEFTKLQSTAASMPINSVGSFIDANLDVLRGDLRVPRISGLNVAPHVYLEWVLSAKPANIKAATHIGDGAVLHPTARIRDCVIGRKATILPNAKLERCVVLEGATVPEGAQYSDAIISEGLTVFRNANDTARELEQFALESAVR